MYVQLHGSGRMWVAPRAEMDPSAVSVKAEGQDLAVEAVARRYLPEGMAAPTGMVVGRASLTASMQVGMLSRGCSRTCALSALSVVCPWPACQPASMRLLLTDHPQSHACLPSALCLQGSHMEPTIDLALQLPEASAACTAQLRRTSARLTLASPSADAAGTLHLQPPSFDAVKAANTQVQASALAQLNLTGLDADVSLRGLDVVPLVSDEVALRQLAVQSGQPLRLKLNGRAKVSGTVQHQQPTGPSGAWQFAGDLGLESVRVNQLKLFQKLGCRLTVSDNSISVHGRGQRANETLDLDLSLPLLPGCPPAAPVDQEGQSGLPDDEVASAASASAADEAGTAAEQPLRAAQRGGGGLQLRCGPLQVAADVNAAGSQLDFKVTGRAPAAGFLLTAYQPPAANTGADERPLPPCRPGMQVAALKLDELELASLRGDLQVRGRVAPGLPWS